MLADHLCMSFCIAVRDIVSDVMSVCVLGPLSVVLSCGSTVNTD